MRSGELSSYLKDPWILLNLALRITLLAVVLHSKGFLQFDSGYYLENAQKVASGLWGGDSLRTPLYSWILAITSVFGHFQIGFTLLIQTLAIFFAGALLYKPDDRLPAFIWVFDPGLLVYSNIVMTDALFAFSVLLLAISLLRGLKKPDVQSSAYAGFWAGVGILIRPIAIPTTGVTLLVFAWFGVLQKRYLSVACFVTMLASTLSPVLVWNVSHYHQIFIARQGNGWIQSVAGVVENHGRRLNFYDSELLWHREHPQAGSSDAYKSIQAHWTTWAALSFQGAGRVAVGHLNSEWATLFTGRTPVGPGWIKQDSFSNSQRVHGAGAIVWAAGVLVTFFYYIGIYLLAWKRWQCTSPENKYVGQLLLGWALVTAFLFMFLPQVYGDARFRLPLIGLLTATMLLSTRQSFRES